MLNHQFLKPSQLLRREAEVPRQGNRLQPELGRQIVSIDMDMRRLIWFMAIEVQPVRAASQDGRHATSTVGLATTLHLKPPFLGEHISPGPASCPILHFKESRIGDRAAA
jgi:hypothetical protein